MEQRRHIEAKQWKKGNLSKINGTRSVRDKTRLMEAYIEKDKAVKKSVREYKRGWIAERVERAQKAAESGRQKELYNIVRQLTG